MKQQLRGVIPAVLTPIGKDGEPDLDLLVKQTEYLATAGAHGFLVAGTTAEGAFLSTQQKRAIYTTVREVSAGRQFLCLAALQPSTPQVTAEIHELADLEPDYFVAVTPFFGRMDQQTIQDHFAIIAEVSPAPLIIYNIPGRTQSPIAVQTIQHLAQHPNIAGIKDSSGDFVFFSQGFLGDNPDSFVWIIGEDLLDAPALLLGARCIVSGLSNIRVEHYLAMLRYAEAGDVEKVIECQYLINRYRTVLDAGPTSKMNAATKAGAAFYGRATRRMIMPSLDLTDDEYNHAKEILSDLRTKTNL